MTCRTGEDMNRKIEVELVECDGKFYGLNHKVKTPFGSCYIHIHWDEHGRICGGSISDPQKEPDAQVAKMIQALSQGLDDILNATTAAVREAQGG